MHKRMQGGSNTKIKLFNWGDPLSQKVLDKSITLFKKLLKGYGDKYDEIHIYSVYPVDSPIPPLDTSKKYCEFNILVNPTLEILLPPST